MALVFSRLKEDDKHNRGGYVRFREKVVIVTAGSSGIGLACAYRFAREGARVLNADIRMPDPEAEMKFRELPGELQWIEADLGDEKIADQVAERALSLWGEIDILVNNAAFVNDQA